MSSVPVFFRRAAHNFGWRKALSSAKHGGVRFASRSQAMARASLTASAVAGMSAALCFALPQQPTAETKARRRLEAINVSQWSLEEKQAFVDQALKQDVVVFSKSTCPECDMGKYALEKSNVQNLVVYELDRMKDNGEIQQLISHKSGTTCVPQIFVKGNLIGKAREVCLLHHRGKLVPLLQATGVAIKGGESR
mmetsp:Transcript_18979/g.26626  ORF Transcript_18979/g.26626 Transcript_18979/m.26626 type:complete len:194 (+) Transcript_18979:61-642(+)